MAIGGFALFLKEMGFIMKGLLIYFRTPRALKSLHSFSFENFASLATEVVRLANSGTFFLVAAPPLVKIAPETTSGRTILPVKLDTPRAATGGDNEGATTPVKLSSGSPA